MADAAMLAVERSCRLRSSPRTRRLSSRAHRRVLAQPHHGRRASRPPPARRTRPSPRRAANSKAIPAPRPGALEAEKAHIARYDKAIAAVRDQSISPADAERLKRHSRASPPRDVAGAKAARDQIEEPIARKLVDWYRLRGGFGEAQEYRAVHRRQSGLAGPRT